MLFAKRETTGFDTLAVDGFGDGNSDCDWVRQRSTALPDGTVPVGNNIQEKGQPNQADLL